MMSINMGDVRIEMSPGKAQEIITPASLSAYDQGARELESGRKLSYVPPQMEAEASERLKLLGDRLQKLPDVADTIDNFFIPELLSAREDFGVTAVEFTVIAHGAGTQTNVLHILSANRERFAGTPYYLPVDFSLHADVGDSGTRCEYERVEDYLMSAQFLNPYTPLYRVTPGYWGKLSGRDCEGGLFDRYLSREIIPVRAFRSCTGDYKIKPQLDMLDYLHKQAAEIAGVDVHIRQVIGYARGEEKRAARYDPSRPWIRGWFPLIEWGWNKAETILNFRKLLPDVHYMLGDPFGSGCWFCPFQPRGDRDPITLEPKPNSWTDLYLNHETEWEKSVTMERVNNERRVSQGKKPIYLYGTKPLDKWMGAKYLNTQMALFDYAEGDLKTDDTCESWGCMR